MSSLPCGADTDDLLEQVAIRDVAAVVDEARVRHQRGCPHCRAALEEYRRLWGPVDALAATVVRAPEAVIDRALARVRAVADNPAVGLLDEDDGSPGSTWIAARVVVACARIAAEEVDGVRAVLGRIDDDETAAAVSGRGGDAVVDVGLSGGTAVVALTVAAGWRQDLQVLAQDVRELVARRVREMTGIRTVTVDVHVDVLVGSVGS